MDMNKTLLEVTVGPEHVDCQWVFGYFNKNDSMVLLCSKRFSERKKSTDKWRKKERKSAYNVILGQQGCFNQVFLLRIFFVLKSINKLHSSQFDDTAYWKVELTTLSQVYGHVEHCLSR